MAAAMALSTAANVAPVVSDTLAAVPCATTAAVAAGNTGGALFSMKAAVVASALLCACSTCAFKLRGKPTAVSTLPSADGAAVGVAAAPASALGFDATVAGAEATPTFDELAVANGALGFAAEAAATVFAKSPDGWAGA